MANVKGQPRKGGRAKGTANKVTYDLQALAQTYTEDALKTLVDIALHGEKEAARVSAANAILDRGYGKPSQAITGADGKDLLAPVLQVVLGG